ncbi:MAG: hypothetical protein IKT87_04025 [Bacteroidaceae bacterium]|nr:hypothetical protein [Bacteroidaceae bacterium]
MKKLLLLFAVLLTSVGAWATGLEDGVYTIKNVINGRGTLCAVEGQNNVGAADITLSGYEGKSQDAVTDGEKWYVFTLFGKTYLYNLGNKKFLADRSRDVAVFAENAPSAGVSITQNGDYYIFKSADYKLSCCPGYDKGNTIRWLSDDEANSQHLTVTRVDNGENDFSESIATAIAKAKQITSTANLENTKAYYLRSKRGALLYNSDNPTQLSSTVAYGNISNTSTAAEWAIIKKNDKYYFYSLEGKKFIGQNTNEGGRYPMQVLPQNDVQIVSSTVSDYPFVFSTDNYGAINHLNHPTAPGVANWKGNSSAGGLRALGDDGSVHQIMAVRDLTDEEVQAINNAFMTYTPNAETEYVLYDVSHKVFLDINNLATAPQQAECKELAKLNSEKQSLYITAEGLSWKIHTATTATVKYLGQYTDKNQWNSKVNEDQSEFAWTSNPVLENGNIFIILQNTSGKQNGFLGNEGHANGSALFVNQTDENQKLKLKLHEASLVYKVITTETNGAAVYEGKNYTNGEYIFANATLKDADISAKSVLGKECTNVVLDEESKTVTLTYAIATNFKDGDKFFIKNRDHANDYICADFSGGKLDKSEGPTTKRISYQTKNGSNIDYRFCWELKATNEEQCFYLYNPYYDWYIGSIRATNQDTYMSKTEEQAGKYKIEIEDNHFVFHCLTSNINAGGQDGNFFHWYSWWGSKQIVGWQRSSTASQWLIEEVTDEMETLWQNTLASQFNTLTQHKIGTGVNQYSGMPENLVEGFKALSLPEEASAIEKARYCVYALYEYGSAVDALTLNMPAAGFYRIMSMNGNDNTKKGQYVQNYVNGTGLKLDRNIDAKSIMYIANNNILSYASGLYVNDYDAEGGVGLIGEVGSVPTSWSIIENRDLIGTYALGGQDNYYLSDWLTSDRTTFGNNDANAAWTFEPVEELPFTFNSKALGYATFCAPVAVQLPENVSAYTSEVIIEGEKSMLVLTKINENIVPAKTPVLLYNATMEVPIVNFGITATDNYISSNSFVGTIATENLNQDKVCYSLQLGQNTGKVGFYKKETGTKGGFKAWLELDNTNGTNETRTFTIIFDGDDATGLKEALGIENEKVEIYDLSGRRLDKPTKGINIINGKKVIK